jgi:hypothetical protein
MLMDISSFGASLDLIQSIYAFASSMDNDVFKISSG